nr:DUF4397 domain-containing protein [Vibrio sonorensis]
MWIKNSVLAVAFAGILVGCNDDDKFNSSLQAVHASKDAPLANVLVNGSSQWTNVDFGTGSGYSRFFAGNATVAVEVQLPGNATATVIPATSIFLDRNNEYTVFVVGEADSSSSFSVEPLVVSKPKQGSASNTSLDVQVVHASAGVADVDLYVTAPGADLNSASLMLRWLTRGRQGF